MRVLGYTLLCLVAIVPLPTAGQDTLARVGVLDLTGDRIDQADLISLSDRLRIELFRTGRFTIVEREAMASILEEQGFQQSGCTSTECVVQMGELVGAEKMIAGHIGRVADVQMLSLRLVDVRSGTIERTAVRDCAGCSLADILTRSIREAALELAGAEAVQAREAAPHQLSLIHI